VSWLSSQKAEYSAAVQPQVAMKSASAADPYQVALMKVSRLLGFERSTALQMVSMVV
jgi:hypothetical protein